MADVAEGVGNKQVAVLIDFENVGIGSIPRLFDRLSNVGRIIVKRAYADWSANVTKREQLLKLGIEEVHLVRGARSGKNASDIRLVIDALDLLYQSPVDTFVVVSSDSDFLPLVHRLRSAGKSVIGAGPRATAAESFVFSCDRYIYLDEEETPNLPQPVTPNKSHAESILMRALRASVDDLGKVVGGKLHTTMQRLDPGFDYKELGYSTFLKFLESSSAVRVTRHQETGDVIVELANGSQPAARSQRARGAETPSRNGDAARAASRASGGPGRRPRAASPAAGQGTPAPAASTSATSQTGLADLLH